MAHRGRADSPDDLALAARRAGVTDGRVLAAIRATPRAAFVPPRYARAAYADRPLPIPHSQVTTQPSLSAVMIAGLGLTGTEQVLEIGTGYGYQAALLARLAAQVVSIEIWPDMAAQAQRNLIAQAVTNVLVVTGDGTLGYPARAPYDAILVSAAFTDVPGPLAAQLRPGGRLVQPIGPGGHEEVTVFERETESLRPLAVLTLASFVRLYGKHGFPPDGALPLTRRCRDLRPCYPAGRAPENAMCDHRVRDPYPCPGGKMRVLIPLPDTDFGPTEVAVPWRILREQVARFWALGRPVGAICHGVLVLARTVDPATGRSLLADRQTTCLPKYLERLSYLVTGWRLGRYYRTYPAYVEDEVKAALAGLLQSAPRTGR